MAYIYENRNPFNKRVGDCVIRAIFVPATAGTDYGNVTSTAIIKVPKGCCFSVSIEPVVASADPTVTAAPIIDVIDSNLVITRIA